MATSSLPNEVRQKRANPPIIFDIETGMLSIDGKRVYPTPREAQLFWILHRHVGAPVSYEQIAATGLIGSGNAKNGYKPWNLIQQFVCLFRKKLKGTRYAINCLRGFGYELVPLEKPRHG